MGREDETDAFGRTHEELSGGWLPPAGARPPQPGPERPEGWQPPAGPRAGSWPADRPRHRRATTALVLSIIGLVVCPLVCSVAGLALGYRARAEIDASAGALGGRGNASAAIVLGWVGLVLGVLAVLLVLGTPAV